jgi:quinol monooxygenase YgiN
MNKVLVVVATLTAKTGCEAFVKEALERVVPSSRLESGCMRYELHTDNDAAGRFVMLEEWRSADALAQHETSAHFQALVESIGGKADVQISKLTRIA